MPLRLPPPEDRHRSHLTRLEGGEVLPLVVDRAGVPPYLAHLYALHLRANRSAVSTLHKEMLRVAELHDAWAAVAGAALDGFLRDGRFPDRRLLQRAMDLANTEGGRTTALKRVGAWGGFLRWVADEYNWWPLARGAPDSQRTASRLAAVDAGMQEGARAAKALPHGKPREQHELTARDLAAVVAVIGPDSGGSFAGSIFGPQVRLRNWLLYQLLRHLGLRVGEALALKVGSLPRLSPREVVARQFEALRTPQALRVERIPDDPDNRRTRVAVKRQSRSVKVPDALADLVWLYVDGEGPEGRPECASPFLLVTANGEPLSESGAQEVLDATAEAAQGWHLERHGYGSPGLSTLHFHAFRHYRAVEALPEFFPDGIDTPGRRAEYLAYFGWKNERSAMPYLRRLSERTGHAIATRDISR